MMEVWSREAGSGPAHADGSVFSFPLAYISGVASEKRDAAFRLESCDQSRETRVM